MKKSNLKTLGLILLTSSIISANSNIINAKETSSNHNVKDNIAIKSTIIPYSSEYIASYDIGLRIADGGMEVNASVLCLPKMDNITVSVDLMERRGYDWYKVTTFSQNTSQMNECVLSKVYSGAIDGRVYKAIATYTAKIGNNSESRSLESSEKSYFK